MNKKRMRKHIMEEKKCGAQLHTMNSAILSYKAGAEKGAARSRLDRAG